MHTPPDGHPRGQSGFTIVELLIVIVIIGILASITIIVYNGLVGRANDTAVKADLVNFNAVLAQQKAINGTYPATLTSALNISFNKGNYSLDYQNYNVRYCYNSATDDYILYAVSRSGNYFRYIGSQGLSTAANTYGWGVCSQIGLVNTNPSQNGDNNGTWDTSWVH